MYVSVLQNFRLQVGLYTNDCSLYRKKSHRKKKSGTRVLSCPSPKECYIFLIWKPEASELKTEVIQLKLIQCTNEN